MRIKLRNILWFTFSVVYFKQTVDGAGFLLPIELPDLVPKEIDSISQKLFFFLSNCTSGVGNIRLIFYSPTFNAIEASIETIETLSVDSSLDTIFLIHGFLSHGTRDWINDTISALLKNPYNIFVVDWKNGACAETVKFTNLHSYGSAAANTKAVGEYVASCVETLCDIYSLSLTKVWLIGHSLGAHVSGFAGKAIYSHTAKKVGRITGLDPAGPLFEGFDSSSRLDKTDAMFVEVVHTSGLFGLQERIGDVDLYYNGGLFQGSCILDLPGCSHGRAVDYYIEAIRNPDCHFMAKAWSRFQGYRNIPSRYFQSYTIAGPLADKFSARGTFYVQTNTQTPYCTGKFPTTGEIAQLPIAQISLNPLDERTFAYSFGGNENQKY